MVPVHWWTHKPNFGDLLAPWLVGKITGRPVLYAENHQPAYAVIGSILGHVGSDTVVWGVGSFGTESLEALGRRGAGALVHAVRGPLTRNRLLMAGIDCPRVYGDPALLVPEFHPRATEPVHELGLVIRHSEQRWRRQFNAPGVLLIDLKSDDVEGVLDQILSCRRILTSSLHGLIIADAYGIPSAWLASSTPAGREFKYWDYFCSTEKLRPSLDLDLTGAGWTAERLLSDVPYDGRPIRIDLELLKDRCPFWPGSAVFEEASASDPERR